MLRTCTPIKVEEDTLYAETPCVWHIIVSLAIFLLSKDAFRLPLLKTLFESTSQNLRLLLLLLLLMTPGVQCVETKLRRARYVP